MLKSKEIRDTSSEELEVKLETLKAEIFEIKSARLDAKSEKTHEARQKRREIARIKTIQKERELKGQS